MKFAAAALLLGCTALASKFAMQSDLFHLDFVSGQIRLADPSEIFLALERIRFYSPHIPWAPITIDDALAKPALRIQLTKADALVLIEAAATKHRVAAAFVKSIVAAESNFDCNAVSPKGAIGLMQLMPDTARQFGADPTVPEQNIDAGTHYLRVLMNRYQKCGQSLKRVIAAYNAGPGKVDRYRGVPPYRETRAYVARVLGFLRHFEQLAKRATKG